MEKVDTAVRHQMVRDHKEAMDTADTENPLEADEKENEPNNNIKEVIEEVPKVPQRTIRLNPKPYVSKVGASMFRKEPTLYSHTVYKQAGKVFQALKHEDQVEGQEQGGQMTGKRQDNSKSGGLEDGFMNFGSQDERRFTFELAFSALKFQNLLETMLDDCAFFGHYPELREETGTIMVMLFDFQNRKFQRRSPKEDEETNPFYIQIEEAILKCKTKLNASLARQRIKANAATLDHLLPENVRCKQKVSVGSPQYVWVNLLKSTLQDVLTQFQDEEQFVQTQTEPTKLEDFKGKIYYLDPHCDDLIIFPPEFKQTLQQHPLNRDGVIVVQDKSSCLGPHSVRLLINQGDDIIFTSASSGMTTAHIASLITNDANEEWDKSNIFAFGARSAQHLEDLKKKMRAYNCRNVICMKEDFLNSDPDDPKFKNVKVILVSAQCSKSGIIDPVDFIVSEGEDMGILKYLSRGEVDQAKLGELITQHNKILKHAMQFPSAHAVVYATRSVTENENEGVVNKACEQVNAAQYIGRLPFRVAPPVLPFSEHDIERSVGISGKFIKFTPTNIMSGCFVAVITREADDPKEATKDMMAGAKEKGILGKGGGGPTAKIDEPIVEEAFDEDDDKKGKGGKGKDKKGKKK